MFVLHRALSLLAVINCEACQALLRRLAKTFAITIPIERAIGCIFTWNQASALDALFLDPIDHVTVLVIATRWPHALTVSTNSTTFTLAVYNTDGRRRNGDTT